MAKSGTVTPTWYFNKADGTNMGAKPITITPIAKSTLTGWTNIVAEPLKGTTTNGTYSRTLFNGLAVRVELSGYDLWTQTNWFPTNAVGNVAAADYTALSTNLSAGVFAYSTTVSDQRYQPLSTNLNGWSLLPTNLLSSGGTTLTNTSGAAGVITGGGIGTNVTLAQLPSAVVTNGQSSFSIGAGGIATTGALIGDGTYGANGAFFVSAQTHQVNIASNLNVSGTINGDGSGLTNLPIVGTLTNNTTGAATKATNSANGVAFGTMANARTNDYVSTNLLLATSGGITGSVATVSGTTTITLTATNSLTAAQTATLANAVTNQVITLNNSNILQNFVGLPMTRMFKKLVVVGDSKSCTLYTNGWYSYGGYTNASVTSTVTNQPDGTLQFNIGAGSYLSNNISLWAVLTNRIGTSLGYPVALDTAMCVPGTSLGNIIGGYPTTTNVRAIGSGFQQFYGKPLTNSANGTVTNAFGFYAGIGPITLYSSNMVAFGSVMARNTNLTGVIYQGVTYTVTNGAPITITPTNTQATKGYTSVILTGTPNYVFNCDDSYTLYPGAANNYFPPYAGSSVSNSTNNTPPINWLFTNAPALTRTPTAFALMCGGNDASVVMGQTYETNQTVILMAATNIYNLAVASFQLARSNGYYPNILAIYPISYSFTALGSQYQVMTNYNNLLRQMPVSLVDIIVDLDAAAAAKGIYTGANPSGTNYLGGTTTSLGDGVHYSLAYTTEQGDLMFTNSYLSTLTPLAGWVPSGATPPAYSGLWNSNGLGSIYYIRAGVKTNYITGP